jgi:sterol desaturase/sphingolipid hydroxylase (fatty acid hydroxylase superfamily)
MLRESIMPMTSFAGPIKSLVSLVNEFGIVALLAFFFVLSIAETRKPHIKTGLKDLRLSYKTNSSLFVINSVVLSVLQVSSLLFVAEKYADTGLLRSISNPVVQIILAFVLLDLLLYLWHKACHNFDCLWMFHRVHHNDPGLNSSTAFRVHILEILLTTVIKAVYIVVLGVNVAVIVSLEIFITFFVLFHHSNITFNGEKFLGKIIIVPSLHRVHHSAKRAEHDSNFGAVFSFWDRLFATFKELVPEKIGIQGKSPLDVINLIKFGFSIETPILASNSGPGSNHHVPLETMIAEAAYYKAEKRNFTPGNELFDWLEAKREIIQRVYGNP